MPMNITGGTAAKQLAQAIESGENMESAFAAAMDEVAERVRADYADVQEQKDYAILASRGYRTLTSAEERFYNGMAEALRDRSPKQAFADFIGANAMPVTILESIINEIQSDHEFLDSIAFLPVGYGTKVPRDISGLAIATWGKITATITKELEGGVDLIDLTQKRETAFVLIYLDVLDMGPKFIDMLLRTALKEAVYNGMERAIIKGSGHDEPIGMNRSVYVGVQVDSSTGYPEKQKLALTSLRKENYLPIVATMAKNEFGKPRKFDHICAVMNMYTKLTKWDAAKPEIKGEAAMPFPTTEFVSTEVPDNTVILYVPNGYTMGIGGSRNGDIEVSDDVKFLEDQRCLKIIQHGDGRPVDDTACVVLDVSGLRPYVQRIIDVKNDGAMLLSYGITISDVDYWFDINEAAHTAELEVPYGTSLSSLVGNFVLSDGATAKIGSTGQTSGTTANAWTDGTAKNFKVTSEDGAVVATYAMTINVAEQAAE